MEPRQPEKPAPHYRIGSPPLSRETSRSGSLVRADAATTWAFGVERPVEVSKNLVAPRPYGQQHDGEFMGGNCYKSPTVDNPWRSIVGLFRFRMLIRGKLTVGSNSPS
jgi:hypothetical protein